MQELTIEEITQYQESLKRRRLNYVIIILFYSNI